MFGSEFASIGMGDALKGIDEAVAPRPIMRSCGWLESSSASSSSSADVPPRDPESLLSKEVSCAVAKDASRLVFASVSGRGGSG